MSPYAGGVELVETLHANKLEIFTKLGAGAMMPDRKRALFLEDVLADTWDASRQSLLYAGRLLDFLAFTEPKAGPCVDRAQMALDAVFDELHGLPPSIPRQTPSHLVWRRKDIGRALNLLVEAAEWEHPSQVLGRPRPSDRELLSLCNLLLEEAEPEQKERLTEVHRKLERTVRIAAEARERRRQMTDGG